jgi:hypothetical protein
MQLANSAGLCDLELVQHISALKERFVLSYNKVLRSNEKLVSRKNRRTSDELYLEDASDSSCMWPEKKMKNQEGKKLGSRMLKKKSVRLPIHQLLCFFGMSIKKEGNEPSSVLKYTLDVTCHYSRPLHFI